MGAVAGAGVRTTGLAAATTGACGIGSGNGRDAGRDGGGTDAPPLVPRVEIARSCVRRGSTTAAERATGLGGLVILSISWRPTPETTFATGFLAAGCNVNDDVSSAGGWLGTSTGGVKTGGVTTACAIVPVATGRSVRIDPHQAPAMAATKIAAANDQ